MAREAELERVNVTKPGRAGNAHGGDGGSMRLGRRPRLQGLLSSLAMPGGTGQGGHPPGGFTESGRHRLTEFSAARRRQRSRPTLVTAWLAVSDVAAIMLAMLAAWGVATLLFDHGTIVRQRPPLAIAGAPLLLIGVIAYLRTTGRYYRRFPLSAEIRQVLLAGFMALLGNACLEFSFKTSASRVVVCGTWLAFPVIATVLRGVVKAGLRRAGLWTVPTLIVGEGELGQLCARTLTADPGLGYLVVGQTGGLSDAEAPAGGLAAVMAQCGATFVVIATDNGVSPANEVVEMLVRDNVPFAISPPLHGLPVIPSSVSYFPSHDVVLLSYRNSLLEPAARALKVTFDLAVAGLLLVFTAPVLIAIALAVRADGGPALYSHTRVGANGRRFGCLKFRSMVMDSDARLEALLRSDPAAAAEWQARQKLQRDPRITRIGAWLRKTSLDELPQLLNIARLEMSLVGPRPIVESELVHYGNDINYYFQARPGITGLWQVSGRSDTSYPERVQLDTWYVKNWTLWHDMTILARTVPAVLHRRGAV